MVRLGGCNSVRRLSLGPLRCQVAKLSRGKIRKRRGRTASPGSSFCSNSEGLLGNPHSPSVSLGAARQVWHAPPELSARILNSKLPGHPAGQLAWSLNPRQAPPQDLVKISGSDPAMFENSSRGGRASPRAQLSFGSGRSWGSRGRSPSQAASFQRGS